LRRKRRNSTSNLTLTGHPSRWSKRNRQRKDLLLHMKDFTNPLKRREVDLSEHQGHRSNFFSTLRSMRSPKSSQEKAKLKKFS
jgi:hypothetical protein